MALRLARRGWYTAAPNPRVGCVLVRAGQVVGSGWHERTGEAHAEVMALERARERARGATAYVTLEPCIHYGRTPPCCHRLIEAGIAKVVTAMRDPNPQVSGNGIKALCAAGIVVEEDVLRDEAEAINTGFIMRQRSGKPHVRLKLAMSMDGRIAMASGESKWISGEPARTEVQDMRAASCVILTGIGTVLSDNPRFTIRPEQWHPAHSFPATQPLPQPLVVVVDSKLRLPKEARVRQLGKRLLVAHCTADEPTNNEQISFWRAPERAGKIDLRVLLSYLAKEREHNNVLVECGSILTKALIVDQLVDEFCFYIAPIILGSKARSALDLQIDHLKEALNLRVVEQRTVGKDFFVRAVPNGTQ